jgi:ABC-type transporter Mla subunit MlaD
MKIRRFNEGEQVEISSERVTEIIEQLKELTSIMDDKSKSVESLLNELDNFKSDSKRGNDQIDDSIVALQVIKKDIDDCVDKIDTTINNLSDYNDSGRKFLYTDEDIK